MEHLEKLFEFLISLKGLGALCCGVVWIVLAIQNRLARWALFGAAMYAASLHKYFDPWEQIFWPPFSGPVEVAVRNGRPLSAVLLGALVVVGVWTKPPGFSIRATPLMAPIHAIQGLILAKLLLAGGDFALTVQAGIIFLLIGVFSATGLRQWAFQMDRLTLAAAALSTTGLLFVAVSEAHLLINPGAVMLRGRLMGTTSNPQHAAVLLAICLLGPVYFLTTYKQRPPWLLALSGVLCLGTLHLLLLTGSRTGVCMGIIGVVVLLRQRLSPAAIIGIFLVGGAAILLKESYEASNVQSLMRTTDTRTHVWRAQWNTFLQYPLFGKPEMGEQFRSGENSWLGLMAATGIFGVSVLLWLLARIGMTARELYRLSKFGYRSVDIDFCLAGLLAIFAGSFFEAYLLGVITMPVLFIAMLSATCEATIRDCRATHGIRKRWRGQLPEAPAGAVVSSPAGRGV